MAAKLSTISTSSNIWHSDKIARISPQDGHVIAWIDLTGLLPSDQKIDAEAVLNGIAYDSEHDRLFVTGKEWPTIFEIKIVHLPHEQHNSHQFHQKHEETRMRDICDNSLP
jgi:hypothetical protein